MILKKVCVLGASAVGKTSLVSRFVHGIFSDVYQTTLGVKIDRKAIQVGGVSLDLILWDLEGDDEFAQLRLGYLRGAAGYLLVADGTRRHTLETALRLRQDAGRVVGEVPSVLLLNKLDRFEEWEISERDVAELKASGLRIERSSAKTGAGIPEALDYLGRALLAASVQPAAGQAR